MKITRRIRYGWAATVLIASPLVAQDPQLPHPAPPLVGSEVVPAVVMPPLPAPAPIQFPKTETQVDQVGHHPARLQRPVSVSQQMAMAMPAAQPTNLPATNWPMLAPPASAAPQWRWYGWGAALPAGADKSNLNVEAKTVLPAPVPNTESIKTPTKDLIGEMNSPEPNWNAPPKSVMPPTSINNEPPTPSLTPPGLDMQLQTPKPASKPNAPPVIEPWTGIGPTTKTDGARRDVVASSTWTIVRASGNR